MGIAGIASLLKWGVAVVLAISLIPLASRDPKSIDSEFELSEEGKIDLSGYEITVLKYKVNKTMLNSPIIRSYGFVIERAGRVLAELYVQKHFRSEWEFSDDARTEYTTWALEEKKSDGYEIISIYPGFENFVLNFPAFDFAMTDVQNLVKKRFVTDVNIN